MPIKPKIEKTKITVEEQPIKIVQRADIPPKSGYALVVDGHFKKEFAEETAVKTAATDLLTKYSMLKIEIYDATTKTRELMK